MSAYAIRAAMCIARGEPVPPLDGAPNRRSFEAINLALKVASGESVQPFAARPVEQTPDLVGGVTEQRGGIGDISLADATGGKRRHGLRAPPSPSSRPPQPRHRRRWRCL